eukprot:12293555-Alexandrium_andersonii.AAC.1
MAPPAMPLGCAGLPPCRLWPRLAPPAMPRPRVALQSRLLVLMKLRAQVLRPPTKPLAVPLAGRTGAGRA